MIRPSPQRALWYLAHFSSLSVPFLEDMEKGKKRQGKIPSSWNLARCRVFVLTLSYRSDFRYSHTRLQSQKIVLFRLGYFILMIPQLCHAVGPQCLASVHWTCLSTHTLGVSYFKCTFASRKGRKPAWHGNEPSERNFFESEASNGRGKGEEMCKSTERIFCFPPIKWEKNTKINKALDNR